jgi:hypothetical protein
MDANNQPATNRTRNMPVIRWGAVWAGSLIAVGLFVVTSLLWLALAYNGHGMGYWQRNLDWWEGGTAIAAWFIGGAVVGRLTTGRASAAISAGVMWVLGELAALIAASPLILRRLGTDLHTLPGPLLWIVFGSVAIGLPAAVIAAGGSARSADDQTAAVSPHAEAAAAPSGQVRTVPTQPDPTGEWANAGRHRS